MLRRTDTDPQTSTAPQDGGVVAADIAGPAAGAIASEIPVERQSGAWPAVTWRIDDDAPRQGDELPPPTTEQVLQALLRLGRDVALDSPDEKIVHAFVETMRALLPGRRFAVRLLSREGDDVELFYASGRVRPGQRDPLVLEAKAAERHGLAAEDLERLGVMLSDRYLPFFEPGAAGFDVPLTDGTRLIGILSVEVPAGFALPASDPPILVPLALEMASKIRGARLLREMTYLRDFLAQVIDRANAPIVVLGADRRVEKVNLAFLRATRAPRERWKGQDFVSLLPVGERARAIAVLDAAARGQATSDVELRLPREGGGVARISFNTAAIVAPDGEITGIVAIGRDMTDVRKLEEQIIHAEKLATLGQLAAGVVHELNNPLTSILVYSEYLLTKGRRTGADPADLEKLARVSEAAARMLRFTRDLVTYARPSNEEPQSLSIAEVIDQALVFCDHVISEAKVSVERDYADDLFPIWAVRGQLHQVLINLITNACHAIATRGQGGSIRIAAAPDREGGGIVVTVADDGPGIAPEHIAHIFEPFFSTKGEGKGTGLGLSIVRNIVQQHGGTIDVETRYGETPSGTTFTLRFPRAPVAPSSPPSP
jgi:PAS domain S-box-containing protein